MAESAIIRTEVRRAKRARDTALLQSLHTHRVNDVRRAARRSQLAYAYLRGRTRSEIEPGGSCAHWHLGHPEHMALSKEIRRFGTKDPEDLFGWLKAET